MSECKKVGGGDRNPMFKFDKEGDSLEGVFIGTREVKIDEDTSFVHTVKAADGMFDFWGSGLLNYLLKKVMPETEVKIIFKGYEKVPVKIGTRMVKKDVKQWEVLTK